MGIISWIILGLFAGLLAKLLVPGPNDFRGCLPTILLGMLGSVVGGFIGRWLGMYPADEIHGGGIFMSILGAVLVLVIYQATIGRPRLPS
jgi:uncharacterized membrane protein YeaQ/YmgE (transglycosylase-associated protein family)